MGRSVIAMMKKWWILAVVFTLALSLTSCSGGFDPNLQTGNGVGQTTCSGAKGSFILTINQTGYGMYDLQIDPQQVTPEGIMTQMAFVDVSGDHQVVYTGSLFSGRTVHVNAHIDDLQNFSYLIMATYNPQLQFLQMTAPTRCDLPFPGDSGNNGNGN